MVVFEGNPESSKANMEVSALRGPCAQDLRMGGCQSKLALHDGDTGCFRYSLLYSRRAQPHSLGLTSMLPQLIDSTSGTARDSVQLPAQCLEIDADGVLGVTCQSWPRFTR